MTTDQMNGIINDICNFLIAIFGISITLFTVLYSFILNKKEELRVISNLIKNDKASTLDYQKELFCKASIKIWKSINTHFIILTCVSFLSYITFYVLKTLIQKSFVFESIVTLAFLIIIYISYLLSRTIIGYLKNTQNI